MDDWLPAMLLDLPVIGIFRWSSGPKKTHKNGERRGSSRLVAAAQQIGKLDLSILKLWRFPRLSTSFLSRL